MHTIPLPNGLVKLIAADGHLIAYHADPATASPTVYLGKGDSPDNYTELTAAEVNAWQAAQDAAAQEAGQATAQEAAQEAQASEDTAL